MHTKVLLHALGTIGVCAVSAFSPAACSGGNKSGATEDGGGVATGIGGGSSGASSSGGTSAGGSTSGSSSGSSSGTPSDASLDALLAPSNSTACAVAKRIRGTSTCNFLIGMGNDLANDHTMDGAYTLGTTLDLHYAYMVGLPTKGGWPDWNSGGTFVNILTDTAAAKGVTPMFTLYAMAADGDGNFAMTTNDGDMNLYWQGAKLLFQRLGVFGKPAVVHLEPDFWGYAMQHSVDGSAKVIVSEHAPDCASMPDTLVGMAECLVKLARTYAPKAVIGFHASGWGGTQAQIIQFFKAIHADSADFIATDMLDRDAGCFEAHTDPNCQRSATGLYWDETNTTSPTFHDHLAWATAIHTGLNLPILWWQVPFGVPSTTPGGTSGHYRDNRVHYIFNHTSEFVAAGGLGAAFGTGAGNQTYINTDNNQFKTAVAAYFAAPTSL
jgi:hypothetical protein